METFPLTNEYGVHLHILLNVNCNSIITDEINEFMSRQDYVECSEHFTLTFGVTYRRQMQRT